MVQVILRMTAVAGRGHELIQALQMRMRHTLPPTGCSGAHLAADVHEANVFWYSEDWRDMAALDTELRTGQFSQLLGVMETSAQPPVLEFRVIAETRGLEYVTAVREAQDSNDRP